MAKTAIATHEIARGNRTHGIARLLRQVGDRLDPGVGDHRHRDREQEGAPGRRDAQVDVRSQHMRVEDQEEAEPDEQELRGEVDHSEEDVEVRRLLDPHDVDADEEPGQDDADDDVPGVRPQRLPEDRQVVRDEDHRDRDGDHVVEHLGPGGEERHELVERVPREARGSARLRIADGALGVGRRRRREDQAADDEDDRRQAEGDPGRQPERVVDRRADVAVRGREERRRAEDAFERRCSVSAAVARRRTLRPVA